MITEGQFERYYCKWVVAQANVFRHFFNGNTRRTRYWQRVSNKWLKKINGYKEWPKDWFLGNSGGAE